MTRRTSETSLQAEIAQNAAKIHEWPDEAGECTPEQWEIYVKNQEFRAYDDWIAGDLIELARVSKFQAVVVEETDIWLDEGTVVLGGKSGTQLVENPRARAIATLNSTINQMLRRLGITVMSVGDKMSRTNRAKREREVERQIPIKGKVDVATAEDFLN